jgi:sec-independent protein translocase protein TatC
MKEMSLTEHLTELRYRLIRIAIILIIAFGVCYSQGEIIQDILLAPLRSSLGTDGKVVFLGLLDKVLTQFQLALWSGVILFSPLWFRELWLFIKPGLYDKEVKIILPFVLLGFLLFCAGVAFGYFIVFKYTFETILTFGVANIEATISLKEYIILAIKVLVFLGVLFQLPNVMLIIAFMGLVDKKMLSEARRYVVTAFAVLAAMLTPPDPITMLALWIPLVVLYEVGIILVSMIVVPFKKKQEKELI